DNQKVEMQSGSVILLLGAVVTTILGICTFFIRPRVKRTTESEIPQLREIKEEKLQAQYNVIQEEYKQEQGQIFPDDSNVVPKAIGPRGVIVGISGMYEGAEIPLKDGETIRFGRSSENDLVFSDQTHVSRHHCRITWNDANKMYVVLDTSSAGSYINGREDPIPQNMEISLETGTILDIGDASNRFRLE
ncbi:MAG: FHA domain-containing protein, partial [Eubacterium sp.]|nr:FHA domain-containing protein [Eubacterium sp.]